MRSEHEKSKQALSIDGRSRRRRMKKNNVAMNAFAARSQEGPIVCAVIVCVRAENKEY